MVDCLRRSKTCKFKPPAPPVVSLITIKKKKKSPNTNLKLITTREPMHAEEQTGNKGRENQTR
ncbi:hypothetical protein GYH30_049054 [Glycine max]|uniref:Uncharacterized protein n=1 Tax=Glycine max TaxID=3847 RepID=A0A0R0EVY7_SOYBN|nr:hypothetical protein GYH30_049054 [Glycine max]